VTLLLVLSLLSGCSRGPTEEELKYSALQEQLSTLQQQYQVLQDARANLATATATLAEIEAVAERSRTDEQKAQLEEMPTQINELTATKDEAFEAVQSTVTNFLTVALNDFPEDPMTAEGLEIYSAEAILVANETVIQAGDYKKALGGLEGALGYYDSLGLPPYQPLVDRIAELDDIRFITQERFDLVQKNMTMDEVKELVGVPYYQNIQVDEKRGVETWLYRKREGGAAAVYFKMKTSKVYNKNFEAVKTKVVSD